MRFAFASRAFAIGIAVLIVASCANDRDTHAVYKVGQPYQIEGVWYVIRIDQ